MGLKLAMLLKVTELKLPRRDSLPTIRFWVICPQLNLNMFSWILHSRLFGHFVSSLNMEFIISVSVFFCILILDSSQSVNDVVDILASLFKSLVALLFLFSHLLSSICSMYDFFTLWRWSSSDQLSSYHSMVCFIHAHFTCHYVFCFFFCSSWLYKTVFS